MIMYYPCSENKGADQIRGYCEADLRLCFRLCRLLVSSCGGSYSVLPSQKKRKVPRDTYECPIIIGTLRPISIKKRMGNRVYSAAHVSSLTMPRNLSVILLNIHSGFQVDLRENYSDHS